MTTPERKNRLLHTLQEYVEPGSRVLDLGCGGGQFTHAMFEAGYGTVGMDISENALRFARQQFPMCRFKSLNADGTTSEPSSSFSAVWSTEVIEHVLNVEAFLGEIYRILEAGGILILTTPYHGVLKNLLICLLKFDRHFDPNGSHIRFFDRKGLDRCLKKAGLDPVKFCGVGRVWKMYRTWFVVARKPAS